MAKCKATFETSYETSQCDRKARRERMMIPGEDEVVAVRRVTRRGWQRVKPVRCAICTDYTWRPIMLKEPLEAPEPRHEWMLCAYCFKALLNQMHRAPLSSPVRLRVAVGLIAAERSPSGYCMSEQRAFQREFSWFVWAMVLFALFHLLIFVVLFSIPR